ncbi:hypothetical protein [Parendozoicomonas sp. Alg238-R29]|uniref:hypothetical protein n=1 Tax=Parendozoicomonas sp. Alg238-R29 TaxID=2993446 RepID=UPI00248D6903|nr:hypothetical protein [Parendozoicomonas sp. Alg238-R29]
MASPLIIGGAVVTAGAGALTLLGYCTTPSGTSFNRTVKASPPRQSDIESGHDKSGSTSAKDLGGRTAAKTSVAYKVAAHFVNGARYFGYQYLPGIIAGAFLGGTKEHFSNAVRYVAKEYVGISGEAAKTFSGPGTGKVAAQFGYMLGGFPMGVDLLRWAMRTVTRGRLCNSEENAQKRLAEDNRSMIEAANRTLVDHGERIDILEEESNILDLPKRQEE